MTVKGRMETTKAFKNKKQHGNGHVALVYVLKQLICHLNNSEPFVKKLLKYLVQMSGIFSTSLEHMMQKNPIPIDLAIQLSATIKSLTSVSVQIDFYY